MLRLRKNWKTEKEVRLVFDRMNNDAWSEEHASLQPGGSASPRVALPFDWSRADVKLYPDPRLDEKTLSQIRTALLPCK